MSFHRHVSSLLVIVFAALAAPCAVGNVNKGFQPVSAEELTMKSEPLAPGAPAVILFRQVDRDDMRGAHEYDYYRIKILSEEGRKYADIEIPFLDRWSDVVGIKARTIRPDGSSVDFDGKIFEKTVIKARGYKFLAKTLTLPDVQVGSILEYYYEIKGDSDYIFDSEWIISDELFTKRAEFTLKPYQGSYGLRWAWHNLPPGAPQPTAGKDKIIRLDISNVPALEVEDFMPPRGEVEAHVEFIYHEGPIETEPDKFWTKTGKNLNDELEKFIGKRGAMQSAVAQIISPSDPPEVKLQKIYARVQQFRDTSYEKQKTEQEEKHDKEKTSNNVEELWKRGYGNGQQLTWLYVALVRAAGFEAYGAWTAGRNRYFFDPKSMNARRLNANVAVVVVDGKDRFFDPGDAFAPFGMLQWQETAVSALCLNKDGGRWVKIPVQPSSASRIERTANLKVNEAGDLEGKLTIKYTGLEAMQRRKEERNEDEVERKKFLEEQVKALIPVGSEVELSNQPVWNTSADPLTTEFRIKAPGWVTLAGHRALLPVGIFSAPEKRLFDHANRVYPIYMEYLFQKIDEVTIELPEGWKVSDFPKRVKSDSNTISYDLNFDSNANKLHIQRQLKVDFLLLDMHFYAGLQKFYQGVGSSDDEQIVLQTATATAKK